MSIFKRIYGRRIPATKMDAETPGTTEEKDNVTTANGTTTATTTTTDETKVETTTTTDQATTENCTTTSDAAAQVSTTTGTVETQTSTTEPPQVATTTTTTTAEKGTTTPVVANGTRSFQFGAKAKMFRDMFAQRRVVKFDSDKTQLLCIIGMLTLACLCSFGAIGTNNWQCQGNIHVGLWNTCQEQSTFVAPETNNATAENSTSVTTAVMCTYHNSRNELDFVVTDQTRIDQIQASQGLIICGTIMYVASLVALVFAYRFIKNKQTRNLNMMRNMLVAGIFTQILAFLLQLVGFFLYILTERLSTSVGLLFVYFGLALFATNVINFITIEYKAYKLRQQQIQQLN